MRPLYIAGTGNLSVSLCFPVYFVLFPSDLRRCRRPACIASVPRRDDLLLRFGVGLRPARISPLALLLTYPGSHTGAALGTPVVTGTIPALCANPGRRRPGWDSILGWPRESNGLRGMQPIGPAKRKHAENVLVLRALTNLQVCH